MIGFVPALLDALAVASVGGLGLGIRILIKQGRAMGQMVEDWAGTDARPGVPRQPGVLERLSVVEDNVATVLHEVRPNSGLSMRDSVARIHEATTGDPDPGVGHDQGELA